MNISTELDSSYHVVAGMVPQLVAAAAVLIGFWLAGILVQRVIRRLGLVTDPDKRDILWLAGRASKIVLVLIGLVSALGTLGINVTALVASLGLTGFALGFALRDVLSNAISGILILFYSPFRRGEHITVSGMAGEVTAIDLRYTTLQHGESRILIPNSVVFKETVRVEQPEG